MLRRICTVFIAGMLPATVLAALPGPVTRLLADEGIPDSSLAVVVQPTGKTNSLVTHNIDRPFNPASVIKLLTTYAALHQLGPDYQWKTEIYIRGRLHNGTLNGDLLIKGYGDPYLVDENLQKLVRELRLRNLQHINGDIFLDNSFYDLEKHDPGAFDGKPLRVYNAAPSAVMYNFQSTRFAIHAANSSSVNVMVIPRSDDLVIENRLKLVDKPCKGRYFWPDMLVKPHDQKTLVRFSGEYSRRCGVHLINRAVASPSELFFAAFRDAWKSLGGSISGRMQQRARDESMRLFHTHQSESLGNIIRLVNKYSNNVMTRQILLALGAERFGEPATLEKGRNALKLWMQEQGISTAGLVVDNGAGLSRDTRITARSLRELLQHAWEHHYMPEMLSSLSLLGVDGTARKRDDIPALVGRMHIKTGVLDHVRSMAGYFHAANKKRYIVIMLQNHPDIHYGTGTQIQDGLIEWLDRQTGRKR